MIYDNPCIDALEELETLHPELTRMFGIDKEEHILALIDAGKMEIEKQESLRG